MTISDKIKRLFRRRPPTADELAARDEAEKVRDQMLDDRAREQSTELERFGPRL